MTRNASTDYSRHEVSAPSETPSFTGRSLAGYACIAAATLFWGISATLGRAVFTGRLHVLGTTVDPIPPLMLAQSRTTFAFLVIAPLLFLLRGKNAMRMTRRDAFSAMLVGCLGIAASNFFYYYAIQQTTVATAIILQYTAPVMVLLWMVLRGFQRATPPRLVGVALAVLGSILAIGVVSQATGFPWLSISARDIKLNVSGVLAALAAAVAFSFYNVYGQHLVGKHDRWRILVWALAGAAAGWLLINPPWKVVAAHYDAPQWTFMLIFSAFSIMVPFSLYFWGLQFLDPTRAIVTSCLEPVFAIVIAAAFLGETVNAVQIAGIVIVLLATVLIQIPEREERAAVAIEPME